MQPTTSVGRHLRASRSTRAPNCSTGFSPGPSTFPPPGGGRCCMGAGRVALVRTLLDAGVPVDARDPAGATALLNAAGAGRVDVVQLLLERGADRDARDTQG